MKTTPRDPSLPPTIAIFCDYENVAIGSEEASFGEFQIGLVLARVLDLGNVVVKKAYADWQRYKAARKPLHEANFELVEIPHVSYSGKNSADIQMVVDALDLCYTKTHIDTFVLVSGDSDFSPLVSKLRENDKAVLGVGVKSSTSDRLVENCDRFFYYDDLASIETDGDQGDALAMVVSTARTLLSERDGDLWGSMVKQALKRKQPSFDEGNQGYRSFSELLEDAEAKGLLKLKRDERSGGFLIVEVPTRTRRKKRKR